MTAKESKQEVCHAYCSFVTQWSSFRPLGEVVGGGDDVLVATRRLQAVDLQTQYSKFIYIHVLFYIIVFCQKKAGVMKLPMTPNTKPSVYM